MGICGSPSLYLSGGKLQHIHHHSPNFRFSTTMKVETIRIIVFEGIETFSHYQYDFREEAFNAT